MFEDLSAWMHVDRSRLAAKSLHVRFVVRWQGSALFVFVVCDWRAEAMTGCKDSKMSWAAFYVGFLTRFHLQICKFLPRPQGSPTAGWSPGRISLTCGFNRKQSSFDVVAWIWMRTWSEAVCKCVMQTNYKPPPALPGVPLHQVLP